MGVALHDQERPVLALEAEVGRGFVLSAVCDERSEGMKVGVDFLECVAITQTNYARNYRISGEKRSDYLNEIKCKCLTWSPRVRPDVVHSLELKGRGGS